MRRREQVRPAISTFRSSRVAAFIKACGNSGIPPTWPERYELVMAAEIARSVALTASAGMRYYARGPKSNAERSVNVVPHLRRLHFPTTSRPAVIRSLGSARFRARAHSRRISELRPVPLPPTTLSAPLPPPSRALRAASLAGPAAGGIIRVIQYA